MKEKHGALKAVEREDQRIQELNLSVVDRYAQEHPSSELTRKFHEKAREVSEKKEALRHSIRNLRSLEHAIILMAANKYP